MRTEKDNRLVEHYSPAWSEDSVRLILTPTNAARKTFFYLQGAILKPMRITIPSGGICTLIC